VALCGAATAQPTPIAPVTPAPETAEEPDQDLAEIQDLLARATAEFDGPQQGRSIALFDQVIEKLEAKGQLSPLSVAAHELLAQAYELQGRAYFNLGLQDKAAQYFRSLIQLRPQYSLSKEKVSPKIADFYASVKKVLVGYLAVSSRPPGARVTLNGEFLGLTDFFPLEVLAGEYTVEISREGYQTETRSLSIAPRATEALEIELTRTTASLLFVTEPAGIEIWVDGVHVATTGGSPLPETYEDLRLRGFDPARTSGKTEVANLPLGTHVVELRKRCYEPIKVNVDTPEARDQELEPFRMEDSLGALQLTSDPPGARIYLDGEPKGVTPMHLDNVCSGPHSLEVKHASGKFLQEIDLARAETLVIKCPIRPTLAFLGVVAASASGERVIADAEEAVAKNLARVTSLNLVRPTREHVERILAGEQATLRELLPSAGTDREIVRKLTERLARELEVQGFVLAELPEERLQRIATLHLLAAGNSVPDSIDVHFAESTAYAGLLAEMDRAVPLSRTWSGLITVDAGLADGVPVLRVIPGSPAAQAAIIPGEVVYSADGKEILETTNLLEIVEAKNPSDRLTLHLRGETGSRAVELTLGRTPREVPLNDPTILYNKLMMDLRQTVEGYPGTEKAALARLNLAICALHFRDYVGAHEHLVKAKQELPVRPGISQGTALYYLGLALERLGYAQDAAAAYEQAAASTGATVHDNDGLSVQSLVSRRIAR